VPESLTPYLIAMLAGFVIGIYGHAAKSRLLVGIGILLVFLATALIPIALTIFADDPPPPGPRVPEAVVAPLSGF
jgi:hypothetical protein